MQPQQLTGNESALALLSQIAAIAYSRGAITFADHRAAVEATGMLIHALAPKPETTPDRTDSPAECGGDAVVPDGRKRRKKPGRLTTN